jgi:hypothetical protein
MARRARRPVPRTDRDHGHDGGRDPVGMFMMLVAIHHDSPPAVPA